MSLICPRLLQLGLLLLTVLPTGVRDPHSLYKTLNISFNRKAMYIFISCIYILVIWYCGELYRTYMYK